ncbi:MAG: NADH ubiquinone oxidoreductase [Deltaproteobacteria bacterium]
MEAAARTPNTFLGVPLHRPRVAFFELASCEGCQLQILNREETLLDFLSLVTIDRFREAMSDRGEEYEIAFVEGSVTRPGEEERLRAIRKEAAVLVALGSCACFGGVNRQRNHLRNPAVASPGPEERAFPVRSLSEIVPVDLAIPGCPISKEELERVVLHVALGKSVELPRYPVCMECRAGENLCLFDVGDVCLGPVTRGGCRAWCPTHRVGCRGCRGPAEDANVASLLRIVRERGIPDAAILDRLECFGGFEEHAVAIRTLLATEAIRSR